MPLRQAYSCRSDAILRRRDTERYDDRLTVRCNLVDAFDLLMGFVWFYSAFSRSVTWRGKKLRFGKGSQLRQDDGTLPVRVARRIFSGEQPR